MDETKTFSLPLLGGTKTFSFSLLSGAKTFRVDVLVELKLLAPSDENAPKVLVPYSFIGLKLLASFTQYKMTTLKLLASLSPYKLAALKFLVHLHRNSHHLLLLRCPSSSHFHALLQHGESS